MKFADFNLMLEPAWPWSLPHVGWPGMVAAALLLTGLTIWTYVGVTGATRLRVFTVVLLRLLALTLTFLILLRPSFGVTHLEGVEESKLLFVIDASESMNVADGSAKSTRWDQVAKLWASRNVQRKLQQMKDEQKIEVVKYLADEALRPDEPNAAATGKRTDIGGWLHELWQKHGHEKHLRGIALFSDGADNGTRFSAQEKARQWRGVCRIDAFGAGNPGDPKLGKDIALTHLRVEPTPVPIKSKMTIRAVAQAAGFENAEVDVSVWMQSTAKDAAAEPFRPAGIKGDGKLAIKQAKDQPIVVTCDAPAAGEYKLTVKIGVLPDETNKDNNEISTYVQVVKDSINVLWVDRRRVYEPTFALRYALAPERRFRVHQSEPPPVGSDPIEWYGLNTPYDVIVIGDVSASRFCGGDAKVFDRIHEMVANKTGLLMLGGTEAFAAGGWDKHKPIMDLLPVKFDNAGMSEALLRVEPTKEGLQLPFIQIYADSAKNKELWEDKFYGLHGLAEMGGLKADSTALLTANDKLVMAMGQRGGRVVVFGGDSTWQAWYGNQEAVDGYKRFWRQLVLWLAQHDGANQLWINLDKRRLNAGTSDVLGFSFGLRGKSGELPRPQFTAKIVGPNDREYPVAFVLDAQQQHQRGSFSGAREPGEYRLIVTGKGKEPDGTPVDKTESARFLVETSDIEMAQPAADHEALSKIASAADGRFQLAEEPQLLQWLDELRSQVNSESRMKTTQWPDWKRLPASDHARDQLSGLWHSFALGSFLLFTLLIGCEWLLRRLWGLV